MPNSTAPIGTPDPEPDAFQRALGDYLAHLEQHGTAALDEFRHKHPEFAERLGRQIEWLATHFAGRREDQEALPAAIGPYRVQQRLGTGGNGEVFLAEQTKPFRRAVAIKVIRADRVDSGRIARFRTEVQMLASLHHDGIAKVFEASEADGRPYLTMEYVPGKALDDYCNDEHLDLPARLRLFLAVCDAIAYAHRQGVMHRDLKPSNILVYGPRSAPTAKIIDFGLARLVQADAQQQLTQTGAAVGTPDYMSPEQLRAERVDTRTDVYALGVVLYQLLTGVLPLSLSRLRKDPAAMVRELHEHEPSSPSVRIGESSASGEPVLARIGAMSLRHLRRLLAGDLDAIVLKALAKDADRRYHSVDELAADLQRHLRHEPVAARPATRGYLLYKLYRRHRLGSWFAATLGLVSAASLTTIWLLREAQLRSLERGDLFGIAHYLQQLQQRDEVPPAARPEHLEELRNLRQEFHNVRAEAAHLQSWRSANAALAAAAGGPPRWSTGRYADQVLAEVLQGTLDELAEMSAPGGEFDCLDLRIEWAGRVVAETVDAHRDEWAQACARVRADKRFAGRDLLPQPGLVPLGPNAQTYEEFALALPGGTAPQRIAGGWAIRGDSWPVFVLLPGGTVKVGAQKSPLKEPHHDHECGPFDAAVEIVQLPPMFVSKYELTNGQWSLLAPRRMAHQASADFGELVQPVVAITDVQMLHVLYAYGIRLPMSEEWDYLARGGSTTPFCSGREKTNLRGYANLYDETAQARTDLQGENEVVPWADQHEVTAPVGLLRPNGFGLHDVHGNANEIAVRTDRDGRTTFELRGGSWHQGARAARITATVAWHGQPLPSIGCRPVMSLQK